VVADTFDDPASAASEVAYDHQETIKGGDKEAPSAPVNSIQLVKDKFTEQFSGSPRPPVLLTMLTYLS
jgi:hypothetical protein